MTILEQLRTHRILAILRGISADKAANTAQALYDGGIRMLEITFDQSSPSRQSDTAATICAVKERLGDRMAVGAGTVLSPAEVDAAYRAGASFLLAPDVNLAVIARAKELGAAMIPGAFTPTEIALAHRLGAEAVKVFPAGMLGTAYLQAVKGPLPHIPLLAVGGIHIQNAKAFLAVSDGIGVGSALVDRGLIAKNQYEELTQRASRFAACADVMEPVGSGEIYENHEFDAV